jgi:serine/threonine protein kinase
MSLPPGKHLGAYEIVALVGAGGMGEVYRARDTRLDRTVAIKVLPSLLAADPQLRDRFNREARAISSLNHPNICTLFDVGQYENIDYLVLEYLEGETLAARLDRGDRLAPSEALRIAIDICDALDKAHRSGIVHRDLKPANVFLVRRGGASTPPVAKLLDFGLAKSAGPALATSGLSMLPTTPPNLTQQGAILGTLQYMAPEQIEGLEADGRTDIFAFGALLFEMLTGRRAFEGKTQASLLGAILKDLAPTVSQIQPDVPAALDRIISTCLAKDPDDRYQSARDLLRDLRWAASDTPASVAAKTAATSSLGSRLAWSIAAIAMAALGTLTVISLPRARESVSPESPVRFTIDAPEQAAFGGPVGGGTGTATQIAVSPDGLSVVFVARHQSSFQIWLRSLASAAATPIPGTEDGTFPFWSPDSRSIGFFAAGKLKKVQISGGPPVTLSDAPVGRGGAWNRDNVIVFAASSTGSGLVRVSSAGGTPEAVTTLDPTTGETNHRWPHFLPDGRRFVYTAVVGTCCPPLKPSSIRMGSLESGDADVTLFQAESSVAYAFGHLLYSRDESLMAQAFDPDSHQLKGDAFPVAERVSTEGSRYTSVSVSSTGTMVYGVGGTPAGLQLTWFDREGHMLGKLADPGPYLNVALSPEGRRVAVAFGPDNPTDRGIWVIDVARGVRSRQTLGRDLSPIWSPDGTRLAFQSSRTVGVTMREKEIDATAPDEPLLEGSTAPQSLTQSIAPTSWSSDGRFIAYTYRSSVNTSDVWILPRFGDRKPFPFIQSEFIDAGGVFSPDGRWIAYTTTEGSQSNVFVQPFPGAGRRYQVSRDGGSHPSWRADGKELYYVSADDMLMAVSIATSDSLQAGVPVPLFRFDGGLPAVSSGLVTLTTYAATKDGKRFLVSSQAQESFARPLSVILNWPATIHR